MVRFGGEEEKSAVTGVPGCDSMVFEGYFADGTSTAGCNEIIVRGLLVRSGSAVISGCIRVGAQT